MGSRSKKKGAGAENDEAKNAEAAEIAPEPEQIKKKKAPALAVVDGEEKKGGKGEGEKKGKGPSLATLEAKIERLRHEQQRVEWEIGSALKVIRQDDLWRATGAKSFGEYVQLRFGFSATTAKDFIAIAECFSREQASKVGPTHLRLLTKVPTDEDRAKLYAELERHPETTVRELADKVSARRSEAGLKTERGGFEGTVLVNARLQVGLVAQGKWATEKSRSSGKERRVGRFSIGSSEFVFEDLGADGFVVRLLDLAAAERAS